MSLIVLLSAADVYMGVTKQSNGVTSNGVTRNRVTGKNSIGKKIKILK